MKKHGSLYLKLYYRLLFYLLPRRKMKIPADMDQKKNVFLYFDYEREFSGHKTTISDSDIEYLISLLSGRSFKATWFTVGKIFLKYPGTIKKIIEAGHELASHSYSHIPPVQLNASELRKEFSMTESEAPVKINGFHAPKSQWSIASMKLMKDFKYEYEVVSVPKEKYFVPFRQVTPWNHDLLRMHTVGDDWSLFGKNRTEAEIFDHFRNLFLKIRKGEIAGIGFHPWVLFSDQEILSGFKLFLGFLSEQEDVNIDTALHFSRRLNS